MKVIYILIVLLVAAVAVGCVGKTSPESAAPDSQQQSAVSTNVSTNTTGESDEYGIQSDIQTLDSMFNDTDMNISFEVNADTFT